MSAPSALSAPVPASTPVILDPSAQFYGDDLVGGGSPWRLLRVPGPTRAVLERWRRGDAVRAGEERLARTLVNQGLLVPAYPLPPDVDDVEVVVPVRDAARCLASLLGRLGGLAVVVVDDGSADPDAVAAVCAAHGARLLRHDASRGAGAARNTGIRATTREFVWFVDVDVIIDDATATATRLRGALVDPMVGAAAPRVVGAAGESARDRFERSFGALDLGGRGGLVHPLGPVPYVPSACLMVRRGRRGHRLRRDHVCRRGRRLRLAPDR